MVQLGWPAGFRPGSRQCPRGGEPLGIRLRRADPRALTPVGEPTACPERALSNGWTAGGTRPRRGCLPANARAVTGRRARARVDAGREGDGEMWPAPAA